MVRPVIPSHADQAAIEADHVDDSYGTCVVCRLWVPHTDDETVGVPWPCPAAALSDAEADAERLAEALESLLRRLWGHPDEVAARAALALHRERRPTEEGT